MFDEEKNIQQDVQTLQVAEDVVQDQHESIQTAEQQQESDYAKNFKALRLAKERAERERDEMARRFAEIEARLPKQESDEINLAPDDIAEGKHLNKVDKKIKVLEAQLIEARLKSQYPDFDKIVSADNLSSLRSSYPEIERTIQSSPDLYSKAVSAYTMIKKLGIVQEDIYQEDRDRVHKNSSKPRPLASVSPQQGDSPLSKANAFANGLTDELKAQLRKEMEAARRDL